MPRTSPRTTITVGDLIAAAYNCATAVTGESGLAARLAAGAVARRLARAHRPDLARRLGAVARSRPAVEGRNRNQVLARAA